MRVLLNWLYLFKMIKPFVCGDERFYSQIHWLRSYYTLTFLTKYLINFYPHNSLGENMGKLLNIVSSIKTMIFLTAIFAISSAVATFIENDHGSETAWAVVYGAKWFEIVMVLLWINLFINIFRFKLYKREKLGIFLFHAGFLVLLIGAAITRYVGFEGLLHVRESTVEDKITSSNNYIQLTAFKDGKYYHTEEKILISKITPNNFSTKLKIDGKVATLKFKKYYPNAIKKAVADPNGVAMINMMLLLPSQKPRLLTLKSGEVKNFSGVTISLNSNNDADISIKNGGEEFFIQTKEPISWFKMSDRSSGGFKANTKEPFATKRLYQYKNIKFVPRELMPKGTIKLLNSQDKTSGGRKTNISHKEAIIATLEYDGKREDLELFGYGKGSLGEMVKTKIDGVEFSAVWGAKFYKLPFSIKLNDFVLERYPGSMSPSSYSSDVVLIDPSKNLNMPYKIYMNHTLDYKGYRLFQSSYDMDERGSVLSVNHDPGKLPTYIGYLMLAIGFILTLMSPKSRFRKLAKRVQNSSLLSLAFILLLLSSGPLVAKDSIQYTIPKSHAEKFGDLLVQTHDGRIKTLDTFANELMLKLHKSNSLGDLNADQVLLGMLTKPQYWQQIPLIRVKHDKIKKILGLSKDTKYASFNDFFVNQHQYKLASVASESMQKRPIQRNEFDRSVMKVDEMLNISYMIFTGDLLKIVPKVDDPNKKWYSVKDAIGTFPKDESIQVRGLFVNYFGAIDKALNGGSWDKADEALKKLSDYQYFISSDIIPPKNRLQAEKIFKKLSITNKLIIVYMLIGLILLALYLTKIIKPNSNLKVATKALITIYIISFLLHTLVLAARWYIGGHAPWSNAYEAMLYVSWSMALSGVIFMRYSSLAPALTAIIAASTLAATFFNEMNPQITNLVPVLKSYWLNIHVSVITASYGFLGLSAILGLFSLVLFIIKSPSNEARISQSIEDATRLNEMTAIIGLMMLTIGNFLGGVWANESWGRYWGWDPKETWAWISILVYVIVTHLRLIPSLKRNYAYHFSVASLLAYSSIVMTFVGVNYYLSGMHSYAAGDPVPIPKYLYLIIAIVFAIIALAYPKRELEKRV